MQQHSNISIRSVFRFRTPKTPMPFTGERYVSGVIGDIQSEHYHRYLMALRYVRDLDVLDIASGEGFGSALLGQVARSVLGIDLAAEAVRFANENYLTERVYFRRGDAMALPIADRSVDVVVSFETIEHLSDHKAFVAEIRRVLRPGGRLVISSPDRKVYSEDSHTENPFHVRELSRQEFHDLLCANFAHVTLLEQRALTGSVIMRTSEVGSVAEVEGFTTDDGLTFERSGGVPNCPYLVAVASDTQLQPAPHSIMHTPRGIWHLEEMHQRTAAELASAAAERDLRGKEVDRLAAELARAAAERDLRGKEVDRLAAELARAAAERDLRGKEVDRLAAELARAAAERDLRGKEVTYLYDDLARVSTELEEARQQMSEAQAALRQVVESTTWRITRPLRNLLARHPKVARAARRFIYLVKWTLTGKLIARLRERRAIRSEAAALIHAGDFDPAWYIANNPDVAARGVDPAWHYVAYGRAEGRLPRPTLPALSVLKPSENRAQRTIWSEAAALIRTAGFDPAWYVANNPDVAASGVEPAWHYVAYGKAEGRIPFKSFALSEPLIIADGCREWSTYESMVQRITEDRARQLSEVKATSLPMISLDDRELEQVAAELEFPEEEQPLVSIIVPVFNNLRITLECLLSLRQNTDSGTPYEIVLGDDASTDASGEVLPRIRNVSYFRNETNLGFLMNCNSAAQRARGEFVLLLNNDVQVTPGWLAALVQAFSAHPNVGAVGPRIVYPSGHLQEAGGIVNPDCSTLLIGLNDDAARPRYNFARRVDYCSGACLMLRREVFTEVGGFTESFRPAYCEDLDLCLKLRERGLDTWYVPQSVIVHHLSKSDGLGSTDKMRCIVTNQQKISERWQTEVDAGNRVRLFAFYLPQFHTIPENDRWWGRGFTEWTNVTRAVPQYAGHRQPRLPSDFGFYDLRRPEVLTAQANLARRYGIEGFCYYYYWFNGKRLLETPLEAMLASGEPDFPFLLCWANENWTRRWDGQEAEVLIAQSHSDEDDAAVIRDLMRYFRDPRYVRVNGRPMLLVYRVALFPDFARTADNWRRLCRMEGIGEIYLAMVASFEETGERPVQAFGCDATVQFPPHRGAVAQTAPRGPTVPDFEGVIFDYEQSVLSYLRQPMAAAPYFPSVMPSWDNTPRRMRRALVFENATPGAFQAWLEEAMRLTREHNSGDERIVFINAWNEWAEGNYLEPDQVLGHANLEAVRNALMPNIPNIG